MTTTGDSVSPLGEARVVGPYLAWRRTREGILERYVAVRRDDDARTLVDVLTATLARFPGPLRGAHPSLPPIIEEGKLDAEGRWWARESTEGIPLVRIVGRTSVQGASIDVGMAAWLAAAIGGAALAAGRDEEGERATPSTSRVVVRFDDGRPVLLRDKPHYDDDVAALEWGRTRVTAPQSLVALFSQCLNARAPIGDPFRRVSLPPSLVDALDTAWSRTEIDRHLDDWRALVDELTGAAALAATPLAHRAAWHGAVHALFPEESAAHRALVEDIANVAVRE